jgi:hypothetical protein
MAMMNMAHTQQEISEICHTSQLLIGRGENTIRQKDNTGLKLE